MGRLQFNRSFEDELAQKADEFRMQPKAELWDKIESGMDKSASVSNTKYLAAGTSIVIILLSLFIFSNSELSVNNLEIIRSILPGNDSERLFKQPSHIFGLNENAFEPETEESSMPFFDNLIVPYTSSKINTIGKEEKRIEEPAPEEQNPVQDVQDAQPAEQPKKDKSSFIKPIKPSPKKDGWYLTFSGNVSYSFRTLDPKNTFAVPVTEDRNKGDKAAAGISARATAKYYFNNDFAISAGIGYNRWGEYMSLEKKPVSIYYDSAAREKGFTAADLYSSGDMIKYQNMYHQLDIPVLLHFEKFKRNRFSISTSVGISFAYTFSEKYKCYDYALDHYVKNPNNLRNFNANLIGGISALYRVNKNLSLMAGPEGRYSFLSTYSDSYPISQHQYSVGLNVGVQWKLFAVKPGLDQ